MRKQIGLLAILAFTAMLVSNNQLLAQPEYDVPSGQDKFARIVYPAANCLDPAEGTCELWVRNDFDPSVRLANAFYVPMYFFRVQEEGSRDEKMYLLTRSVKNGRDVGFRVGQAVDFVGLDKFGWRERNEWHYLALTWVGDRQRYTLRLYQDGRLIDQVTDNQAAPLRIGVKTEIVVGSPVFACSFATVDELRISAIERSPDEIAQAARQDQGGFAWDRWTLLLDHFDRIEPDSSRTDTAWTKTEGGIRGQIQGRYQQTEGRFGSALQLHTVDEHLPAGTP